MNNDLQSGLSDSEARQLLLKFGLNEIRKEQSISPVFILLSQFKSPLVIILIFATIVSIFLQENMEAIAIITILALNAIIGFFQEYRAETAISALKKITSPRSTVFRDGKKKVLLSNQIVPGDILFLEAGDIIAADADILQSSRLQINESALTGESLPIEKSAQSKKENQKLAERTGEVFMGTVVLTGTATVRVGQTGMNTELGKIAHLISEVKTEKTPLQVQLENVGKTLLFICLGLVAFIALIGHLKGISWNELLLFSVSLAVAAVPEGLPAIVTIALALGVQRMSSRRALIRKLPSVETLGSVSIICTDKTGTLTTGQMKVREIWGHDRLKILRAAASCCDASFDLDSKKGTGDPTEVAILIEAASVGVFKDEIEQSNPRISTEPFDSVKRRMSVYRSDSINYFKGATENIIPICNLNTEESKNIIEKTKSLTSKGLRVLAIANGTGHIEKNLNFIGLIGLADPPRDEAMQAIKEARMAGIKSIMITGDHPQTAAVIAKELGLLLEGESIDERVHARATPEDKLKLVKHWKNKGEIVAMTGDGVNDAPALREAHIGIAMGVSGTEVTRQAADLILADDNFATIIAAVREGRGLFQNIRKSIQYLLTGNFAELLLVVGAVILNHPLPLLASHLLWINLVTDSLPALTLIAEPLSPNLMKIPPRLKSEKIMGKNEWLQVVWVGLLEALVSLSVYIHFLKIRNEDTARNLVFSTIVLSQLFRALSARSNTRTFLQVGLLSNKWLLSVIMFTVILQISLHYFPISQSIFDVRPLEFNEAIILFLASITPVTVIELKKLLFKGKIN